jgi:hypothetical protein
MKSPLRSKKVTGDNEDTPEVGYGKPPKGAQFQRGRSGNPKGRPKGVKNLATLLEEELEAKVPVTEHGRHKKITKRRAAVKQIVNKAASGDMKAFGTILAESRLRETTKVGESIAEVFGTAQDEKVIAGIIDRLRRNLGAELERVPEDGVEPVEEPKT